MLKLINLGPIEFKKYIQENNLYIFGAGRALKSCMDLYCAKKEVKAIIDNNCNLWGKKIEHEGKNVPIIGLESLIREFRDRNSLEQAVLLISSPFYAADIVEELDKVPELDGLECFLQILIRNTKENVEDFEFTEGENKIPKKIHYIWVGGKPLPYEFEKNIETWRKYNPDYEIIRWDETNYDFTKCAYVREAYEAKQWGFVPNFARLDIIYQHGGIYLDTDVEAIKGFDCLLKDEVFMNMGCADRVNQGCGFGSIEGHAMIYDMLTSFEESHFLLQSGKPEKKACHTFIHPIMRKYGFELENRYQKHDGMVLYPCEVMSPLTIDGMASFWSQKTISIHKEAGTWKSDKEKKGYEKLSVLIKNRIAQGEDYE